MITNTQQLFESDLNDQVIQAASKKQLQPLERFLQVKNTFKARMDILTAILDILFLLIAIAFFPSAHFFADPSAVVDPIDPTPPVDNSDARAKPSSQSTPATSPLCSPVPPYLSVPTIRIIPERPSHKRKTVSFSVTSTDEVVNGILIKQRRPPTPFVSGPVSPGQEKVEDVRTPETPMVPSHMAVDPMGVQKGWLMP